MIHILILVLLVGLAIAAVRVRNLLTATAILGAYSLMMALLWCDINALDVAFTEAAVGAGISTVLMLAALQRIGVEEKGSTRGPLARLMLRTMHEHQIRVRGRGIRSARAAALGAVVVCILFGGVLLYGTADMPRVGDPDAPANAHPEVAQHYIRESEDEVGPPNMVTSVLGDYRGYDTMGETTVIFTAALCVLLLLRYPQGRRRREEDA
jgi:multicomponent Na+:H+ antiporter subunit B